MPSGVTCRQRRTLRHNKSLFLLCSSRIYVSQHDHAAPIAVEYSVIPTSIHQKEFCAIHCSIVDVGMCLYMVVWGVWSLIRVCI